MLIVIISFSFVKFKKNSNQIVFAFDDTIGDSLEK